MKHDSLNYLHEGFPFRVHQNFVYFQRRLRVRAEGRGETGITLFSFKCTWAQQEGRNFKSSSRILQRVRDLRYARCSPETRDSNGSLTTRFLSTEWNCHLQETLRNAISFRFREMNRIFFLTRTVSHHCLYVFLFSSHRERFQIFPYNI